MVQFNEQVDSPNVGLYPISVAIDLGAGAQRHIPAPFNARLKKARVAINGATDTDDETVTIKDTNGNVLTTINIPNGSAEGDVLSSEAVNKTLTAGQNIEVEVDGANGQTVAAVVQLVLEADFMEND